MLSLSSVALTDAKGLALNRAGHLKVTLPLGQQLGGGTIGFLDGLPSGFRWSEKISRAKSSPLSLDFHFDRYACLTPAANPNRAFSKILLFPYGYGLFQSINHIVARVEGRPAMS